MRLRQAGTVLLVISGLVAASPAVAQETPTPACVASRDADLPPYLSGWTTRTSLKAGARADDPDLGTAEIGRAFAVALRPTGEVRFPVAPGKPGAADSLGGLVAFAVTEDGDYQVALGGGAWIEVVGAEGLAASSRHAHGPACTTLRKMVVFPLKSGRYQLEITGAHDPVLPVMISRVPSVVQVGAERRQTGLQGGHGEAGHGRGEAFRLQGGDEGVRS